MSKAQENLKDMLEKRIEELSQEDIARALRDFRERLDSSQAASLNSCPRCGLCSDSCHYYLSKREVKSSPSYKLSVVEKVFKRYFSLLGKHLPAWAGAEPLDKDMIREWVDALYGRCSLCGRCSLNCSVGINVAYIIKAARGVLASLGVVPSGLESTVRTAVEKGNNMGIALEDWKETVEWLEQELKEELGDPEAEIPLDRKNTELLYTINPREAMFFPLSIVAAAKIFNAAGESWTLSSQNFDVTNYGFYIGDDALAAELSARLVRELEKLNARTLVLAECGHGYNANRWEAPQWLGKKYEFEVKSILQLVAEYIREGRIKLDPALNPEKITLHDPCNLVRFGGVVEEQRLILKRSASNFVEMNPNREKNFCCGGGGGQLAMSRFRERRLEAGRVKAEQIRRTGAKVVVAPCHNCLDQLFYFRRE